MTGKSKAPPTDASSPLAVKPADKAPLQNHSPQFVIDTLEPLLTEARVRRMRDVLAHRSNHVAFVFERMIDPHNLSAALRSLDAFSFPDVHLVQPGDRLGLSRGITIGTDRWLNLHTAPDSPACLAALRTSGYRILASHLDIADAIPLTEIDFSQRTALIFGNEHLGVGEEMLAGADGCFRIDMMGFAQSLNLSVSVAISAFHARQALTQLSQASGDPGRFGLSPEEREGMYARWLRLSVKHADRILAERAEESA